MERKLINFKEKSKGTMRVLTNICLCMLFLFVCLSFYFPLGLVDKENEDNITSVNNIIMFASASEETGASSAPSSEKGGCHYLGAGTKMTMSEGSITGTTKKYGGAVFISSGATFTMSGGTISGCTARYGGAIYVASGGTLNMTGGTIKECGATYAPAIYVEENATVTINGEVLDCFYGKYYQPTPVESISTDTIMVGQATEGIAMHYLDYGTYPQTYVGDAMNTTLENWYSSNSPTAQTAYEIINKFSSGTNSKTWISYLYTDGNYYVRGSSYPYSTSYTYSDGTTVKSNGTTVWFKVEPIRWIVLNYDEIEAGTATEIKCVSELALTANVPFDYNTSSPNNAWNTSDLQDWLNNYFINQAFTSAEQEAILTTEVLNNTTATYSSDGSGETTYDKIYCLSYAETTKYFNSAENNRGYYCSPTDFAQSNQAETTSSTTYTTRVRAGTCGWYTRSAGSAEGKVCYISYYGSKILNYGTVYAYKASIRPAVSFII